MCLWPNTIYRFASISTKLEIQDTDGSKIIETRARAIVINQHSLHCTRVGLEGINNYDSLHLVSIDFSAIPTFDPILVGIVFTSS